MAGFVFHLGAVRKSRSILEDSKTGKRACKLLLGQQTSHSQLAAILVADTLAQLPRARLNKQWRPSALRLYPLWRDLLGARASANYQADRIYIYQRQARREN